jgi:hypothetical protein
VCFNGTGQGKGRRKWLGRLLQRHGIGLFPEKLYLYEHAPAHGMAADGLAKAIRSQILTLLHHFPELFIGQGAPVRIILGFLI